MARHDVEDFARACGLSEVGIANVALAMSEAVTNAVVHAKAQTIYVSVEKAGEELRVLVADNGIGLVPRRDSPGLGLGLPIIATLAERFEVVTTEQRTEIHMTFTCETVT